MEPFLGSEDLLIDMAELFKVFGDSTRIKILCCLFDGEMYVQELADRVGGQPVGDFSSAPAAEAGQAGEKPTAGEAGGLPSGRRSCEDHSGNGKRTFGGGTIIMRKSYALEDLDCANCAAKMEAAINKMPQVEKSNGELYDLSLVSGGAGRHRHGGPSGGGSEGDPQGRARLPHCDEMTKKTEELIDSDYPGSGSVSGRDDSGTGRGGALGLLDGGGAVLCCPGCCAAWRLQSKRSKTLAMAMCLMSIF